MHRKYCLRQSNELKGGSKTGKPWKDKKRGGEKEESQTNQTNSETMDQKTGQTKQMKEAEEKK